MAIEIIEEAPLRLTRAEYEALKREYEITAQYTVGMVDFETWARARKSGDSALQKALKRDGVVTWRRGKPVPMPGIDAPLNIDR